MILFTGGGSASVHVGIPHPHPPWSTAYWEIWSTSGRYASYWNAILVAIILRDLILLVDLKGRPSDLQILGLLKSLFTFFLQTTDLSTPATKVVEETILEKSENFFAGKFGKHIYIFEETEVRMKRVFLSL